MRCSSISPVPKVNTWLKVASVLFFVEVKPLDIKMIDKWNLTHRQGPLK